MALKAEIKYQKKHNKNNPIIKNKIVFIFILFEAFSILFFINKVPFSVILKKSFSNNDKYSNKKDII
jgi:hypothetical protein